MAEKTGISWCHSTFNPWRGCTRVSTGCERCYAETMSKRNPSTLGVWGPQGKRVVASEDYWKQPLKWNRQAEKAGERRRVFCASMADWLEDWTGVVHNHENKAMRVLPCGLWSEIADGICRQLTLNDMRARLLKTIHLTPNLDWLLLTKRPENFWQLMRETASLRHERWQDIVDGAELADQWGRCDTPMPNIHFGVTAENQDAADKRIPLLNEIHASVRWLSCEPLLGPIEFSDVSRRSDAVKQLGKRSLDGINWTVVGGESGPHRRDMDLAWMQSIADQCQAAEVPVFIKQDSSLRDGQQGRIPDALWSLKQFPSVER